jgi:hypothetical protein
MRKIIRTFLAIAVALFAITSCVDNTESDSVAAMRNAKASELLANADYLKAQAQYLKDKAAIEKTIADAQAILIKAQADTEAAQQKYLEDLGTAEKLLAEADSLRAEAEKLRAAGDKALSEARAKQLLAQALQTELKAKADSAEAAEKLRVTVATNAVSIAKQEALLIEAELHAKKSMVLLQQQYILAVGSFEYAVAQKYAELVGDLNTQLEAIATANSTIVEQTIAIAQYESNLAWAAIESDRVIKQQTAILSQEKTRDSLQLVLLKHQLAVLEANDGGVARAAEAKQSLVNDTVEAQQALAEAETEATAKKAALEAVTPAYETALANYTTASDNLLKYYAATAGDVYYYTSSSADYYENVSTVVKNGVTYSISDLILGSDYTIRYPDNGYGYHYINYYKEDRDNLAHIYVYIYEYFDIIDGVDQSIYNVYKRWTVSDLIPQYYNYDSKYVSVEQLIHDIEVQKVDTTDKAVLLADAATALSDAIDSLGEYATLELTTNAALKVAEKAKADAQTAVDEANAAFIAARNKGQLTTASHQDTLDWQNAAKDYNWTDIEGNDLPGKGTAADDSKVNLQADANTAYTDAETAHNTAYTTYNSYITTVRSSIAAHITAKSNYENSVTTLKSLESYKPILELGTRDVLEFAKQEAEKALEAPKKAYQAAEFESIEANIALTNVQNQYDNAKSVLTTFEDWYSKWIVGELVYNDKVYDIGNYLQNLYNKADQIANKQREIAYYEDNIARLEKLLADVGQVGASIIDNINASIANAKALIEKAEKDKAEAEQKAKFYQDAIDAFLAEYSE